MPKEKREIKVTFQSQDLYLLISILMQSVWFIFWKEFQIVCSDVPVGVPHTKQKKKLFGYLYPRQAHKITHTSHILQRFRYSSCRTVTIHLMKILSKFEESVRHAQNVKGYMSALLSKLQIHLLLHLHESIRDYGQTSPFKTERY